MKFILFLIALFTFTVNILNAQAPTDCNDWSSCDDPWHYEQFPIAADTLGCEMLVYYKWRECNGSRDVEIRRIDLINGTCSTGSNSAVVNKAIQAILVNSAAIFLESSGYDYNVTVKIPGCVRLSVIDYYLAISNAGCSDDCCTKTYTMHFEDGVMICKGQTTNQSQITCNSPTGNTCETYCNDTDVPLNTPLFAKTYNMDWTCTPDGQTVACNNMLDEGIKSVLYNDSGMTLLINYLYRKCGREQFEIKIIGIQIIRYPGSWPQYEFIRFSYRVVFKELDRFTYLLNSDYTPYQIGTYVNSCWTTTLSRDNPPKIIFIYPCTDTYHCCYRYITVTKQPSNDYFITSAAPPLIANNYSCTSYSCTDQCSVVTEFSENTGALPKISIANISDSQDIFYVYPNPSEDILNIKGITNINGRLIFSIFDNKGKELIYKIFNKNNNEFIKEINISSLSNGIYYYKIHIGKYFYKGSFVVYK